MLTSEQVELRARARRLAVALMGYELACDSEGGLAAQTLAEIKELVLSARLNAANMPAEFGGQGLSIVEQVIVEEQLGHLTNSLWALVWRPANALIACTAAQRDRYLVPAIRGHRRGAVAITEADAGSDPTAIRTTATRTGSGYRIEGEKWFVTSGDVGDFLIVLARVMPDDRFALFLVDKDQAGVTIKETPAFMHVYVFEHPTFALDLEVDDSALLGKWARGTS